MPNTREKLEVIAHIGDHITYREGIGICYDSALAKVIEDAYMTLKNGVTVQKWIPVTERLPETNYRVWVIACVDGKKSYVRLFERTTIRGKLVERFKYPWDTITCENITHWMPLPEAPKGE